MRNMVTNVYAKANYDRLRTNKALGFRKSHNKKKKHDNKKPTNDVHSDWGTPSRSKNLQSFLVQNWICMPGPTREHLRLFACSSVYPALASGPVWGLLENGRRQKAQTTNY